MTPLIVTELEAFWKPEPWFVVVLTATGAVLLLALGWLLSRILRGNILMAEPKMSVWGEITCSTHSREPGVGCEAE